MSGAGGGTPNFGRPTSPSPDAAPPPGSGGGTGGQPDPCEKIDVRTVLQSPQPAVVVGLTRGDKLSLQLTGGGAPIIAVTQNGDVAGSIVVQEMSKLIGCLNGGRIFVADVAQITGGAIDVRVHMET